MRVQITRSGGFAGLRQTVSVDTATLPAAEAERLRRLVRGARAGAQATRTTPPAPDRFRYRIEVESRGRTEALGAAEESLGGAVRRLLEFVEEKAAKPRARGRRGKQRPR